jgi:multicomponent Na+:H+ antiporter subunit G
MSEIVPLVLSAVGGLVIAVGLAVMAGGVLGLLRLPDFYTRLHAANVVDVAGAALVLLGLAIASADSGIALRLVLLAALVVALGPTQGQLGANAAHSAGLTPLAGAYTAPRPGGPRNGGAR